MTTEEAQRQRERRGYWLRLARKRAGYTLAAAAELIGYARSSASTVKMWEDGKRDPSVTQLERLADLYGIEPGYFMRPPLTDEERLDHLVNAAGALEREDWEAGQAPGQLDEPATGDEPRRRSA